MKKVTKEVLQESAHKLMFNLSDEQLETLVKEFEIITKQMELIAEIPDVDEAEPMTFPFDVESDVLRDDIASVPCDRNELLKNAHDVKDDQIRLPKVVR